MVVMDIKLFFTVFFTVFLAEMADKTQLATLVYACQQDHAKLTVFLGSALALTLTSAIAVFLGAQFSTWVNPKYLSWISGVAFIVIGVGILIKR